MRRTQAPPAILFDAADTLIELTPTLPELLSREWLGDDGALSPDDVRSVMAVIGAEGRWPDYEADPAVRLASWTAFFRETLRMSGGTDSVDAARRAARYTLEPRNYRCYPDVRTCLARLRAVGHQTALVSNFDWWLHDILDAHELSGLFDMIVVSAEVGVQKPSAEIFALACTRLGRKAADCVFVGDSITVDVQGSAAAGMNPVLIDRYDQFSDFDGPRITTLDPLPEMVSKCLKRGPAIGALRMEIVDKYGLDVGCMSTSEALGAGRPWSGPDIDLLRVVDPHPAYQAALADVGFFVRPGLISWLAPLLDTEQEFMASLSRSGRRNVVHGQRWARAAGARLSVEYPLTESGFASFLDVYERRVADMRNGVNLARGEQHLILEARKSYTGVFLHDFGNMLGGCICWVRPERSLLQLRYAATAAVPQRGALTRALYMATFQLGRELGLRWMSLGNDTSLYGHVIQPGLYEFKKQLGFTPVPAQAVDPGTTTDEADRVMSLRSLTDPALLLAYDQSYATWDGTESAARPRAFVLHILTTCGDIDLRPYRAEFLTDVAITHVPDRRRIG